MGKDFTRDFKVSLELEGEKRISCDDLFSLLENILKYGSISRAASEMGISYRYSWGIVGAAEKALGLELVHRQVGGYEGGGTSLSREGRELLEQYRSFKQEVDSQLQHFIKRTSPSRRPPASEVLVDNNIPEKHLLLASTMEPVETGLLDVLEEAFFQSTGILVRHIALGSGRALEMARKGRVDMALTHAPDLEEEFMRDGWGISAFPVMANDFVLAGPAADPAGIKMIDKAGGVKEAFRRIASSRAPFISRDDRSGTHLRELHIWEGAGVIPGEDWYIVSSGIAGNMGVLRLAREKQAYSLVDRATFLLSRSQDSMKIYIGNEEGTALPGELDNVFSLLLVNPQRVSSVNFEGAVRFAQWIQEAEARQIIDGFGRESFGTPLFSKS
ncbi:MAG: substrate-binding domain-containing protein [Bacillota bacterium]